MTSVPTRPKPAPTVHAPEPIEGTPYVVPARAIDSFNFDRWKTSGSHTRLRTFVVSLAESVAGIPLSAAPTEVPPVVRGLISLLDALEAHIANVPAAHQQMRYGNTAFREWHAWLDQYLQSGALVSHGVLPPELAPAAGELNPYLLDSFGNAWRIDYGTGHELAFVCLLYCLAQLGLLHVPPPLLPSAAPPAASPLDSSRALPPAADGSDDRAAIVLRAFTRYVKVMRALQKTYMLEPAGSHGVWGLDDYCFLPFLFGASQYAAPPAQGAAAAAAGPSSGSGGEDEGGAATDEGGSAAAAPTPATRVPRPAVVLDEQRRAELAAENLYLESVQFVCSVKGPRLSEHSPMLTDIAGVGGWPLIASGLLRMYDAEVLGKRPVVQHLVFGTLLPWEPGPTPGAPSPS